MQDTPIKIRILTENLVRQQGLLAEHGLSMWIEDGPDRILFDVGETDVYVRNALKFGIDLTSARAIVLSHGHSDHGGGMAYFPHENGWPRVVVHPDAFIPKYSKPEHAQQQPKPIGFPWEASNLEGLDDRIAFNTSTLQVSQRLYACTAIPQLSDFEEVPEILMVSGNGLPVTDGTGLRHDDMHDEQMLICPGEQGLTVILGCSHPGVVNSLIHARSLYPGRPIHTVIGGMHLEQADPDRLRQTIDYFREQDIARIVPLHCTGQNVVWQFRQALGDRVQPACTGDAIEIVS